MVKIREWVGTFGRGEQARPVGQAPSPAGSATAQAQARATAGELLPEDRLAVRVNTEMVIWRRIETAHWTEFLRDLIEHHVAETQSRFAARILNDFAREVGRFWHVVPRDFVKYLPQPLEAEDLRGRRA